MKLDDTRCASPHVPGGKTVGHIAPLFMILRGPQQLPNGQKMLTQHLRVLSFTNRLEQQVEKEGCKDRMCVVHPMLRLCSDRHPERVG